MAKRRKPRKEIFNYECSLTGEKFKVTAKANNPDELICVDAYYELNQDKDDRPESVKVKLEREKNKTSSPSTWDELVALSTGKSLDEEESSEEESNESEN